MAVARKSVVERRATRLAAHAAEPGTGGSLAAGSALYLQRTAGNAAVSTLVQRGVWDGVKAAARGVAGLLGVVAGIPDAAYEGVHHAGPGEWFNWTAAGMTYAGDVLTDEEVVALVRYRFKARGWTRGLAHLDYYLSGAGGTYSEDIGALIRSNPRAATRIATLIADKGTGRGILTGTTDSSAPIRKLDYDDLDWWASLGNVDEFSYSVLTAPSSAGTAQVKLTLRDPYQWHPKEDRPTQAFHEAFEDMKFRGVAKDFLSIGTAEVSLPAAEPFPRPVVAP